MVERIRDATVAEEIAAQAGSEQTPTLVLSDTLQAVIFAPQRPPLASSGYIPGFVGTPVAAVALNTSHIGIFGSGAASAICRVNSILISNDTAGGVTHELRRHDAPFTGFPSVASVPGYIDGGSPTSATVFRTTKSDTVAAVGVLLSRIHVPAGVAIVVPCRIILNNGMLTVNPSAVNTAVNVMFEYESWPAIRPQGTFS